MSSSTPDPKTWRPSAAENRPRLYVGQHWQDRSIPVYCYFKGRSKFFHLVQPVSWSIRPLGEALAHKPLWIDFENFMEKMSGTSGEGSWNAELQEANSMLVILRDKYFKQAQLGHDALIYDAVTLEKQVADRQTAVVSLKRKAYFDEVEFEDISML